MNNKAHTILVSVIASYGSRLTTSTANCKAFLADFLSEYAEEKNVLVELHQLQLTKALSTFKGGAIDKKTLTTFIDQLDTQTKIAKHDLAWGVDAWANAIDLDIKSRRMIRKQCFSYVTRELHMVTIRSIEAEPEAVPEVPAVVIDNANQAAIPRVALMGVVTLVSTFSIFQVFKSTLPSDSSPAKTAIEQPVALKERPVIQKAPRPKIVVIKPRQVAQQEPYQLGQNTAVTENLSNPIDIEKLSGKYLTNETVIDTVEISIDFAEAKTEQPLPKVESDKLHADIEAFLTQDQ